MSSLADGGEQRSYPLTHAFAASTASALTINCEQVLGDNDATHARIVAIKLD